MSSFAESQLKKFGWSKGKGLGKHGTGRASPVSLAFNTSQAGLGKREEFADKWWDHVYNKAAGEISIDSKDDGVKLAKVKTEESKKIAQKLLYGNFVKSNSNLETKDWSSNMTDEELFKACGGRMAAKGARSASHTGKLSRVDPNKLLDSDSSDEEEFEKRARAIANGIDLRETERKSEKSVDKKKLEETEVEKKFSKSSKSSKSKSDKSSKSSKSTKSEKKEKKEKSEKSGKSEKQSKDSSSKDSSKDSSSSKKRKRSSQ